MGPQDRSDGPSLEVDEFGGMSDAPPADDLFRALADPKRRTVLSLLNRQESVALDDLVDVLVGEMAADGPVDVDERAQAKIELVHAHVPLLIDAGLVVHDEETDAVELASCPGPVKDLLAFAVEYDRAREHDVDDLA